MKNTQPKRKIEIREKDFFKRSFIGGAGVTVKAYWIYVDDIFIVLKEDKSVAEHIVSQLATQNDFIRSYPSAYKDPYEIVDMLIRRDMRFFEASLTAEETLENKIRYIFSGNVKEVSCAFRFTIFDKEYADRLSDHILTHKRTRGIEISLDAPHIEKLEGKAHV